MKRYRLEFEYKSPFDGQWKKAHRDSDELPSLEGQKGGQLTMADVRNSVILVQETSEWKPL